LHHQDNTGYRPVLEALLGEYNAVANRPFRKPFFSWPTQIVTVPLSGWCIPAAPSGYYE
jgi:hypothetical protein